MYVYFAKKKNKISQSPEEETAVNFSNFPIMGGAFQRTKDASLVHAHSKFLAMLIKNS